MIEHLDVSKETAIYEEGDIGTELYLIMDGEVEVESQGVRPGGGSFAMSGAVVVRWCVAVVRWWCAVVHGAQPRDTSSTRRSGGLSLKCERPRPIPTMCLDLSGPLSRERLAFCRKVL